MTWALVLQQYQFTIKAIKGSENVGADFLSRHSVTSDVWMCCVTVYLFELFVELCFVDLSMYFAGVILQSIWMYV